MPVSQQSGFTFPMIARGPKGRVNYIQNNSQRLIEDSIRQIVLTIPGERLGNPPFGCRLRLIHFDPSSPSYVGVIQNLLVEALSRWEPRITVTSTDIQVSFTTDGKTSIKLRYKINHPDYTVNPFNDVTVII